MCVSGESTLCLEFPVDFTDPPILITPKFSQVVRILCRFLQLRSSITIVQFGLVRSSYLLLGRQTVRSFLISAVIFDISRLKLWMCVR